MRRAFAPRAYRRSRSPPAPPAISTRTWCITRCTRFALDEVDLLFIENVGNLVCPASFDLGQHRDVVLLSVPEGDDKPAKYPVMFRAADLVLMTKADLLEHIPEISTWRSARGSLRRLAQPGAGARPISRARAPAWTRWLDWLHEEKLCE